MQPVLLASLETVKNFSASNKGAASGFVLCGFGLTSVLMAQLNKLYDDSTAGVCAFLDHMAIACSLMQPMRDSNPRAFPRAHRAVGPCAACKRFLSLNAGLSSGLSHACRRSSPRHATYSNINAQGSHL